jgi:hypothetical protein
VYSDSTDHSINLDGAPVNSKSQVNERKNREHMGPKAGDLLEFRNANMRDAAHVLTLPRKFTQLFDSRFKGSSLAFVSFLSGRRTSHLTPKSLETSDGFTNGTEPCT